MMKKKFILFLKIVVTFTILFFILRKIDLREVFLSFKELNIPFVLLAFIFLVFSSFVLSIRWNIFLKKYKKIDNFSLFKIYWASDFVNLFGLASVGGEIYKTLVFGENKKKVLFSSLLSRGYSLIGLFIFGVSMISSYLLFVGAIPRLIFSIAFFSIFTSLFIYLDPKVKHLFYRIVNRRWARRVIEESFVSKKDLWNSSLLNLLFILVVVLFYSSAFYSLGLPVKFLELLIFVPITSILMALPISIQGIGIREFMFLKFAELNGLVVEKVLAVSMISYFIFLVYGLLGSVFFLLKNNGEAKSI